MVLCVEEGRNKKRERKEGKERKQGRKGGSVEDRKKREEENRKGNKCLGENVQRQIKKEN